MPKEDYRRRILGTQYRIPFTDKRVGMSSYTKWRATKDGQSLMDKIKKWFLSWRTHNDAKDIDSSESSWSAGSEYATPEISDDEEEQPRPLTLSQRKQLNRQLLSEKLKSLNLY